MQGFQMSPPRRNKAVPQLRGQPWKLGFPALKIHRIGSATAALETRATRKPKPAGKLQGLTGTSRVMGADGARGRIPPPYPGTVCGSSPTTLGCITHPFSLCFFLIYNRRDIFKNIPAYF